MWLIHTHLKLGKSKMGVIVPRPAPRMASLSVQKSFSSSSPPFLGYISLSEFWRCMLLETFVGPLACALKTKCATQFVTVQSLPTSVTSFFLHILLCQDAAMFSFLSMPGWRLISVCPFVPSVCLGFLSRVSLPCQQIPEVYSSHTVTVGKPFLTLPSHG